MLRRVDTQFGSIPLYVGNVDPDKVFAVFRKDDVFTRFEFSM